MNFPNEVSCSILIDPRDLGNVIGGGQTPGTEDAPEGATVRATRPGDINISFPALAERAQAAALATARGATTAAGNRL